MRQMKSGSAHDLRKDAQARSYEVLRQSLHEAQKRCQAYNENMLRVAHANDELAQTLNTVKNTNKRLVDQLQYQVGFDTVFLFSYSYCCILYFLNVIMGNFQT